MPGEVEFLVFVLFMAAEQLTIGSVVLVSAFQIAFASVCLAAALAFGLGGRDWAAGAFSPHLVRIRAISPAT